MIDEISHPRAHHYKFANNEVRDVFFSDPEMFLTMINSHGNYLLRYLWNEASHNCEYLDMKGLSYELRFTPNKYQVILITMPAPEFITEVYYIAAAFKPGSENPYDTCRYFILEKANPETHPNGTLLCEWGDEVELITTDIHPYPDIYAFYQAVETLLN